MDKNKDISIRRWFESDWEIFKAMRIEAVTGYSHVFLSNYEIASAQDDEFWKSSLRDINKSAIFGLYDGDEAIGLTGIFRLRESPIDSAILGMSYIRDDYKGRGLSDLFYRERIDWAKGQAGITRLIVGHRDGNEASRRANQRWGFVLVSTEDTTFGNGETAKHYTYELRLDKS